MISRLKLTKNERRSSSRNEIAVEKAPVQHGDTRLEINQLVLNRAARLVDFEELFFDNVSPKRCSRNDEVIKNNFVALHANDKRLPLPNGAKIFFLLDFKSAKKLVHALLNRLANGVADVQL